MNTTNKAESVNATLQKSNGKYRIVISYYDESGKRKQKTFATGLAINGNKRKAEKMAEEKLQEFKSKLKGYQSVNGDIIFSEWCGKFLEYKKDHVRDTTMLSYYGIYNTYIKKYFNTTKLKDMTPKVVNNCITELSKNLANSSIGIIITVINGALDYAVVNEIIPLNPCRFVHKDRNNKHKRKQHMHNWTLEETQRLLEELKDENIYPIIYMTVFYGLRRGEVLGLTWDNVNFEKREFYIRRTVARRSDKGYEVRDYCKNKSSERTCTMDKNIFDLLSKLKSQQEEYRTALGDEYISNDYDFVFTRANGKAYTPDGLRQAYIWQLKKHGFPQNRLHDLRHTAATLMFANGADVSTVQHALGHSTASTTMNIYVHNLDKSNSKAASIMSGILK